MGAPHISNIAAFIKPALGTVPEAASAGSVNGPAIDRLGYGSCELVVATGAATGTPTTTSVTSKLQHSDDGSTSWTDLTDGAGPTVAAASSIGSVGVDLAGAKRFVRVSRTVAFTGGTTPTVGVASTVILGGADKLPAV